MRHLTEEETALVQRIRQTPGAGNGPRAANRMRSFMVGLLEFAPYSGQFAPLYTTKSALLLAKGPYLSAQAERMAKTVCELEHSATLRTISAALQKNFAALELERMAASACGAAEEYSSAGGEPSFAAFILISQRCGDPSMGVELSNAANRTDSAADLARSVEECESTRS